MKKLSLLLPCLALFACEANQKGSTPQDYSKKNTGAVKATEPAVAKCSNPIAVQDVPREWEPVQAEKLVDGKEGIFRLVSTRMHGQLIMDGKNETATTLTEVKQTDGAPETKQTVTCKGVEKDSNLTISTGPQLSINRATGEATKRLNIEFQLSNLQNRNSAVAGDLPSPARFGDTRSRADQEEALRALRAHGGDTAHQLYKISAEEFELRLMVVLPNKNKNGGKFTIHSASRYKLEKPAEKAPEKPAEDSEKK